MAEEERVAQTVNTVANGVQFRLRWDDLGEGRALAANQFAVQPAPSGEVFLSVGQVIPPLVAAEPGEDADAVAARLAGSELRVRLLGMYSLTEQGAFELVRLLQQQLQAMAEIAKGSQ